MALCYPEKSKNLRLISFLGSCHSSGIWTPETSIYIIRDWPLTQYLSLPVAAEILEATMRLEKERGEERDLTRIVAFLGSQHKGCIFPHMKI